jgi:small multidrug resistance family-3 protein
VAITLKVVLFTPAAAVHQSLLLAFLGTALASRDWWLMSTHLPAVLGGKALPHGAVVATGVAIYILAGLCEIGGGWLVWQALRCGKPRWWAALGSLTLVAYGFVAALQPQAAFGRAFALYGGYFVVMSVAWGAVLDGFRPDRGDFVGCALVVAGIIVMTAWPRATAPPVA